MPCVYHSDYITTSPLSGPRPAFYDYGPLDSPDQLRTICNVCVICIDNFSVSVHTLFSHSRGICVVFSAVFAGVVNVALLALTAGSDG